MNKPYVRELIPKRRLTAHVMQVKKKRCIDNFMKYCGKYHSTVQLKLQLKEWGKVPLGMNRGYWLHC